MTKYEELENRIKAIELRLNLLIKQAYIAWTLVTILSIISIVQTAIRLVF